MIEINSAQNANLILANWLYGVQDFKTQNNNVFSEIATTSALGIPLMIGFPAAIKYGSKPFQVYKEMKNTPNTNYFQAWKNLNNKTAYLKDDKSIFQTLKNKNQYTNLINYEKELPKYDPNTDVTKLSQKQRLKFENSKIKSNFYDEAKRLIQEAKDKKMTGAVLKEQLRKIREAIRRGDLKLNEAIQNGTIKNISKGEKAAHWLKSKTGVYKVKNKVLQSSKKATALKLAKKGVKGTWIMAAVEGITEIPEIIKAYKIDEKERQEGYSNNRGNKQLAKSSVKVGASVLGYAAGAAAAGAVAGTIVPGIGNVAGAVIGFVGGLIGGAIATWGAGKIMDSALNEKDSLNKTEAQLYAEEKNKEKSKAAEKLAEKADSTKEAQKGLLLASAQKVQEEGGFDDETTLNAFKELVAQRENSIEENKTTNQTQSLINEYDNSSTQYAQAETSEYAPIINQLESIANMNYA